MTPLLKQFGELTAADFELHPVWISCHIVDHDEPWYDETDEETFRPWDRELPADPNEGKLLIRAQFRCNDGRSYPGFLSPPPTPESIAESIRLKVPVWHELGAIQPTMFVAGETLSFWSGFLSPEPDKQKAYRILGQASSIFPLEVCSDPGLCLEQVKVRLEGFYSLVDQKLSVTV